MCQKQEDIIRRNIQMMKKEMHHLYNQDQDIQTERIQHLSQQIDKLINVLLKETITAKK